MHFALIKCGASANVGDASIEFISTGMVKKYYHNSASGTFLDLTPNATTDLLTYTDGIIKSNNKSIGTSNSPIYIYGGNFY
jgi:hypothetical protein